VQRLAKRGVAERRHPAQRLAKRGAAERRQRPQERMGKNGFQRPLAGECGMLETSEPAVILPESRCIERQTSAGG